MAIITLDDLAALRIQLRGKTIVFCSGVFDLTHAGHVLFLEECKKQGDVLIAVVGDDLSVRSLKGADRPILNEDMRLKIIDSLKPVDFSMLGRTPQESPFVFTEQVFDILRPHVYVINEDAFDIPRRRALAQRYGMELRILPRTCPESFENISTSHIIAKIKQS